MDNSTVTVVTVALSTIIGQLFNAHRDIRARRWQRADKLENALAAASQIQLLKLTVAAAALSQRSTAQPTQPREIAYLADRLTELIDAMPQATGPGPLPDAKEEEGKPPCT